MDEKYEPIRQEDFLALRQLIIDSPDASDFTKKIILWLLSKTECFSQPVSIGFRAQPELGSSVISEVHLMNSSTGNTHLGEFLKEIGAQMHIVSTTPDLNVVIRGGGLRRYRETGIPNYLYCDPVLYQADPNWVTIQTIDRVSLEVCEKEDKISKEKIAPLTDEQMKALKDFILEAKDGREFTKKVVLWLIDQTANLTEPVLLIFDDMLDMGHEAAIGVQRMNSSSGQTHLATFMHGLGTPVRIISDGEHTITISSNVVGLNPETKRIYVDIEEADQMEIVKVSTFLKNIKSDPI